MATTRIAGGMRADAHDGERGGARAGGRSGIAVMLRLVGLVRPMAGYMALAVGLGLIGHLLATSITVLAGYGVLAVVDGAPNVPVSAGFDAVTHTTALASAAPDRIAAPLAMSRVFGLMAIAAVLRGVMRYGEQACNHFIAFKLLALIRDRVFRALRRLAPAKLEGRGSGDLLAVITSDIELLEVFFAHTISPVLIAVLFSVALALFIGSFHPLLALVALSAYVLVGAGVLRGTVGIVGMLGVLAICLIPFLQLAFHYLTYKLAAALIGSLLVTAAVAEEDGRYVSAAGYILANTRRKPDIWVSVWVAAKGHNLSLIHI